MALDYSKVTDRQRLAIDEVMDTFEFDKVERHMRHVNWGWAAPTPEDEWHLEVPDIYQLKASLRRLLVNAYTSMTMNKEADPDMNGPCWSSCGGFTVYVWPDDSCQVFFSVTDIWIDSDMLDVDE
jgi:hypothetical protein